MKKTLILTAAVAALAGAANAQVVFEDDFDNYDQNFGNIGFDGDPNVTVWGPQGGTAGHANSDFVREGNEFLGELFGFYSAGSELVLTPASVTFEENVIYDFNAFINAGGDSGDDGSDNTIAMHIGYVDGDVTAADVTLDDFTSLAVASSVADGDAWQLGDGVSYLADASVVGKEVWVGFGPTDDASDMWFDSATLEAVPEPATMLALAAGLTALAARRRRK